jgi:hypothetical protein
MRLVDAAIAALHQAVQSGFVCAPETLASDAWLEPVRAHREFESLLRAAEGEISLARSGLATFGAAVLARVP